MDEPRHPESDNRQPFGPPSETGPALAVLVALAILGILVLPAVAAIVAIDLLGPPRVPHSSHIAVVAAAALTVAEAAIAGLGAAALVEAAWHASTLPGPGPAAFLPWRALRPSRALGGIRRPRAHPFPLPGPAAGEEDAGEPPDRPGLVGAVVRLRRRLAGSPMPAAGVATVCTLALGGWVGLVPSLDSASSVLGSRYSSRIVIQATATSTPPPAADSSPTPDSGPTPTPTAAAPAAARRGSPRGGPSARAVAGVAARSPTATARVAPVGSPTPYVPQAGPVPQATAPAPAQPSPPPPSPTPSPSPSLVPPASGSPVLDQMVWADRPAASGLRAPPLTTAAGNELVLAFISTDGPAGLTQTVTTVTGGGLSWSLVARADGGPGTTEVWQAHAPAPLAAARVDARISADGSEGSITVAAFRTQTGTTAPSVGASGGDGARGGPSNVTLKTSAAGSVVWATGHDWSSATPPVLLGGQGMVHLYLDSAAGDTSWVQSAAPNAVAGTTLTIGTSAPIGDHWNMAAVEITGG